MSLTKIVARFLQFTLVCLTIPYLILGLRPYTVEFVSYSHQFTPDIYSLFTLDMLNNTQRLVFNGSAIMNRNIPEFDILLKVTEHSWKSPFTIVNVKINGCEFLSTIGQRTLQLVYSVRKMIKTYGHLLADKCPIKKGEEYYLTNFYIDVDQLPPRLPYAALDVIVTLKMKRLLIYRGNFSVAIESINKSTKVFRKG